MPIYEYQCGKCGYIFEEVTKELKIGTICPNCSYIAKKILSSSNFKINGYSEKNGYAKGEK